MVFFFSANGGEHCHDDINKPRIRSALQAIKRERVGMRKGFVRFSGAGVGLLLSVFLLTEGVLRADEPVQPQYAYPELSIVPRATDRLQTEALDESHSHWARFLPFQASSIMTLTSGALFYDSNHSNAYIAGIGIGASWLVASTLMAAFYTPYQNANADLISLPHGTTREQLTRERAADEEMHRLASLGEKLRWLSVLTNVGANVAMMASTGNSDSSATGFSSIRKGYQAVSIAFALAPLFFRPHWIDVADEQESYKKRIYSPVATGALFYDQGTREYVPGMQVGFLF